MVLIKGVWQAGLSSSEYQVEPYRGHELKHMHSTFWPSDGITFGAFAHYFLSLRPAHPEPASTAGTYRTRAWTVQIIIIMIKRLWMNIFTWNVQYQRIYVLGTLLPKSEFSLIPPAVHFLYSEHSMRFNKLLMVGKSYKLRISASIMCYIKVTTPPPAPHHLDLPSLFP